jgi:hypothetical protein
MTGKCGLAVLSLIFLCVGCTQMTPSQLALDNADRGKFETGDRPACEIQYAEYALDTKLIAFELVSSGGVHVGFDLLTGFLKLLNIDLKASSGRMSIGMSLLDPLSTSRELSSVIGAGTSYDFGANVDLGFQSIGAGFSFYYKTPISTLAQNSLTDTFTNLTNDMAKNQEPWNTQVVAVPTDNDLVVPIGGFGGLKLGDQFLIYNVQHVWSGTPCASEHLIARKTTPNPVAYATVSQVANNAAVLTVFMDEGHPRQLDVKIAPGAMVLISKLSDDQHDLLRPLLIRNVVGAQLSYDNQQKVDFTGYLKDQIKAVARGFGFLIFSP